MPPSNPEAHARFTEILERYGPRLKFLIRTQLGSDSPLEADDIAQEVRLKLWTLIESDRNRPFAASYIERVVVSTVIDAWRRARIRVTEPLLEDMEQQFDPASQPVAKPERVAQRAQWMTAVQATLDALSGRRKQALQLHLQGFSTQEIAVVLASNEEATRRLLHRAMEQLKSALSARGLEEIE